MADNSREQRNLRHNVVVFGEIGVGKSSVVNMIANKQVAETSANGLACTFGSKSFDATLCNKRIRLWDTAGLPEGDINTVIAGKAITNLYHLLKGLEDGVSLLVLCMRSKIIRSRDYKVFYDGLCQQKVPIVLVVTGLEEEKCMEDWWDRNEKKKGVFKNQGMVFDGHACITATKGKTRNNEAMFAREYEESKVRVQELVGQHCSEKTEEIVEMLKAEKPNSSMIEIVKIIFNIGTRMLNIPPFVLRDKLYKILVEQGGYSDRVAREIANEAEIGEIRKAGGWVPGSNT